MQYSSDEDVVPTKRVRSIIGAVLARLTDAVEWVVQELTLEGDEGLSGVQTGQTVRVINENTGNSRTTEIRTGQFEVVNRSNAEVGGLTGIHVNVKNQSNAQVEEAIGVNVKFRGNNQHTKNAIGLHIHDVSGAEANYALYTHKGTIHHEDKLELVDLNPSGSPSPDNVWVYARDENLYLRNSTGEHLLGGDSVPTGPSGLPLVGQGVSLDPQYEALDLDGVGLTGILPINRGGTGANLSASGGSGHIVKQSSKGATLTVAALTASEIPNLHADKINEGVLNVDRIPNLHADKINEGVLNSARVDWASPGIIGNYDPQDATFTNLLIEESSNFEIRNDTSKWLITRAADSIQPGITIRRARGSLTSPTTLTSGTVIGGLGWDGYDGTNYRFASQIAVIANEGFTAAARGTRMEFSTIANGTTSVTRHLNISNDGVYMYRHGLQQALTGGIFTQTQTVTVSSASSTESTLVGSGVGTATLPANFLKAGKTIRIRARGTLITPGSGSNQLRIRLAFSSGGTLTTISSIGYIALPNNLNETWEFNGDLTCRTAFGETLFTGGSFMRENSIYGLTSVNHTIDISQAYTLALTAQWLNTNSGFSITSTIFTIEVIN